MVEEPTGQLDGDFEAVLQYLKESRGFDFTGYSAPASSAGYAGG